VRYQDILENRGEDQQVVEVEGGQHVTYERWEGCGKVARGERGCMILPPEHHVVDPDSAVRATLTFSITTTLGK
jgi:hypothetical protein